MFYCPDKLFDMASWTLYGWDPILKQGYMPLSQSSEFQCIYQRKSSGTQVGCRGFGNLVYP